MNSFKQRDLAGADRDDISRSRAHPESGDRSLGATAYTHPRVAGGHSRLPAGPGDRLLRAYLGKLDDPDLAPVVDAIEQAGGRVNMDDFYRNTQVNTFKQALRNEDYQGAAKSLPPTVLDRVGTPIFEWLAPRPKLGVFFDMSRDWLAKNADASVEAKREGLGKLWDSVDNRMGHLV